MEPPLPGSAGARSRLDCLDKKQNLCQFSGRFLRARPHLACHAGSLRAGTLQLWQSAPAQGPVETA